MRGGGERGREGGGEGGRERERVKVRESQLITVEVGSQGMVDVSDFAALRNVLNASNKEFSAITTQSNSHGNLRVF